MAKVTDLSTLAKTSAASTDFLLVTNSTTGKSKKITLESLFPAVSTAGTGGQTVYNSATLTNKNQVVFKGIKSGDTGLLTVATASSNVVLTILVNGGTGLSTISKGALLYASANDTIAATAAMSTNGQLLIGNATNGYPSVSTLTAGAGVTITNGAGTITIASAISNAESNIDMRNAANNATYNVDLVAGTAFISGDGSAEGLTVDNAGKVFIGQGTPTPVFADTLNIKGGIRFTNTDAPTIKPTATESSTAGQAVLIEGGSSAGAAAGNLTLKGGTASANGAGGSVILCAGRDTNGTADGTVQLKTYTGGEETVGLTVAAEGQNVTVNSGNLVITAAGKGIVHSGSGTVTQATNHTTGVTIHSTSGKIQLAAVALSAATNVEFTVTNSTVTSDSIIMLTMQDENTTNNASLTVSTHTIGSGSFKISIHNPAATGSTSTTASKIHFLVIN